MRTHYIIAAKVRGAVLCFTGSKFSTDGQAKTFSTRAKARERATELVGRFPVLSSAQVHVKAVHESYKKNPSGYSRAVAGFTRELDEADERLAGFAGRSSKTILKVNEPQIRAGLVVGKLLGVMYETTRDGVRERYKHEFRKTSRPLLIAKHDGTQIGIVGGQYRFTDAGIEDE